MHIAARQSHIKILINVISSAVYGKNLTKIYGKNLWQKPHKNLQ